jgi:hypothetical protein
MKSYVGWMIIVCFFAAAIGIVLLFQQKLSNTPIDSSFASSTLPLSDVTSATVSPPPNIPAGYIEYRNDQYHFSVYYPPEMPPKGYPDRGDALTIAFQPAAGEPGFQIYVAPVNGTQVTPEQFKLDEPSGVMKEAVDTTVDGVVAKKFTSSDASIGETREIWFIKDGFLFEVTTYKTLDSSDSPGAC